MPAYKFGEILLIKWRDITHLERWQDAGSVKDMDLITCKTVGMFHSQDRYAIKVCPTVADNEEALNPIMIPQGCIVQITRLRGR